MRRAVVVFLLVLGCSSPAPGTVPNELCRTVLGGQGQCYTLAYSLENGASTMCPAIDQYLGAMGEVDYTSYKSTNGSCKTMWTDQCTVTDDCTQKDGTREQATVSFRVDKTGMSAVVTSTKGDLVCKYHATAGPLHACK